MQVETGYQYAVTCEGRSWDSGIVPKVSDSKKTTTLKNLKSKTTVRSIKTEEQIGKESQNRETKNPMLQLQNTSAQRRFYNESKYY